MARVVVARRRGLRSGADLDRLDRVVAAVVPQDPVADGGIHARCGHDARGVDPHRRVGRHDVVDGGGVIGSLDEGDPHRRVPHFEAADLDVFRAMPAAEVEAVVVRDLDADRSGVHSPLGDEIETVRRPVVPIAATPITRGGTQLVEARPLDDPRGRALEQGTLIRLAGVEATRGRGERRGPHASPCRLRPGVPRRREASSAGDDRADVATATRRPALGLEHERARGGAPSVVTARCRPARVDMIGVAADEDGPARRGPVWHELRRAVDRLDGFRPGSPVIRIVSVLAVDVQHGRGRGRGGRTDTAGNAEHDEGHHQRQRMAAARGSGMARGAESGPPIRYEGHADHHRRGDAPARRWYVGAPARQDRR